MTSSSVVGDRAELVSSRVGHGSAGFFHAMMSESVAGIVGIGDWGYEASSCC